MKMFDTIKSVAITCCDKMIKYSPEIMTGIGITGVVTGVVLACVATTKAPEVIEEAKENLDVLHDAEESIKEMEVTEEEALVAEKDIKRALTTAYLKTGWQFVKLYAPAIIVEALSITALLGANNIQRKRLSAAAAAYATLDASFKAYRKRVADRFGDEVENEIRYDIHDIKTEEVITDPETGKTKKVKKTEKVANVVDDFSIVYDETTSKAWEPDNDYNETFLRAQESFMNDILRSRGHIFLNEVYDRLGMERTKAGQIVGWVYKPKDPNWKGDNYVSFRTKTLTMDTPTGYKKKIILDFNVDGNVLDLI